MQSKCNTLDLEELDYLKYFQSEFLSFQNR